MLALKRSLLTDGTYWLNLPATSPDRERSQFPFLALVEHSNWMDRRHYGGDVLVYCGDYVPPDHLWFQLDEEALVQRFTSALPLINQDYRPDWLRKAWVFRAPYAQPVPGINHSEKIPETQDPLARPVPGQHEPGLPLGPRHQLRGRTGAPRRAPDAGLEALIRTLCDRLAQHVARYLRGLR